MSKGNGGPAFPITFSDNQGSATMIGMTLRDYFAAKALPCAWDAFDKGYWTCEAEDINRTVAEGAYQLADAMLKAREA